MPRKILARSALEVRRLSAKPGRHSVGEVSGLHLFVSGKSAASWVLRVMCSGKRRDIGLGGYPTVTLERAREKAREALAAIEAGHDPVALKQTARVEQQRAALLSITFREAAEQFMQLKLQELKNDKQRERWRKLLQDYAAPLYSLPVSSIQTPNVVSVLRPIWTDKAETARKLRQRLEPVLSYSIAQGYSSEPNPARWKGNLEFILPALSKVSKTTHHRALPYSEVPELMAKLRTLDGVAAKALRFLILTATRSGEVRHMTWSELDLDLALWSIPGERTKTGQPLDIPLSDGCMQILRSLPCTDVGCVFTANGGRPLGPKTMANLLTRLEVNGTPHGIARSSFKDWTRAETEFKDEISELALGHSVGNAVRAAYARSDLLDLRRELMQQWAAFLSTEPQQKQQQAA